MPPNRSRRSTKLKPIEQSKSEAGLESLKNKILRRVKEETTTAIKPATIRRSPGTEFKKLRSLKFDELDSKRKCFKGSDLLQGQGKLKSKTSRGYLSKKKSQNERKDTRKRPSVVMR